MIASIIKTLISISIFVSPMLIPSLLLIAKTKIEMNNLTIETAQIEHKLLNLNKSNFNLWKTINSNSLIFYTKRLRT
jgi:hypothetical protein